MGVNRVGRGVSCFGLGSDLGGDSELCIAGIQREMGIAGVDTLDALGRSRSRSISIRYSYMSFTVTYCVKCMLNTIESHVSVVSCADCPNQMTSGTLHVAAGSISGLGLAVAQSLVNKRRRQRKFVGVPATSFVVVIHLSKSVFSNTTWETTHLVVRQTRRVPAEPPGHLGKTLRLD